MPDNITPADAPVAPSSGGVGGWIKTHKGAAIGGGAVLLLAVYVYMRHRASAASSSSSSSSGTVPGTSTGGEIYEIAPGYLGADQAYGSSLGYTAGVQSNTGQPTNQNQTVTGVTQSSGSGSSGSVNGNASSTGSTGYGIVNTVLGPMIDLGKEISPGHYTGYDVGGGEPVYFGNTEQLAEGTRYQYTGATVYTPESAQALVSTTPTHV